MRPNHKTTSLEPDAIDQVLEDKPASSSNEAVRRVEETVAFLRTASAPVARRELMGDTMARITREERAPQSVTGVVYGWAGALAASLLVGLFFMHWLRAPATDEQVLTLHPHEQAQAWLVDAQERDGHWDAGRWGGHPSHEVALTALSLIALLDDTDMTAARRDAVHRAGHYLISQLQSLESHQAERRLSAQNRRLAALALVAADHYFPDADWSERGQIASDTLVVGQAAVGEWGYVSREDNGFQTAVLAPEQIRAQATQWLMTTQADHWERLGGTVYVMARASLRM